VHGAVSDPPGEVALRRDGVVVPCENDQRRIRTAFRKKEESVVVGIFRTESRRYEPEHMLSDLAFLATLGGNVHELERPLRQAVSEPDHPRSLDDVAMGSRAHRVRSGGGNFVASIISRGIILE